ncbi:hypothetical protein CK203_016866 [Vitis vinifera]|uniref:Uncharacterized protein n=1 Tax=Vitis vinifera TaxID=29760 RepID=A0A438JNF4_VITVI|nr:hypothetical protein CK203_016866 [Vitis vinifera]
MSKRQFPFAADRSNCGLHCWARDALFLGRLLRIPPNPMSPADEEKTAFITHMVSIAIKSCHWTQKRWRHLSETDDKDLQTSGRPHSRVLANSWDLWSAKGDRGQPGSSQGSHRNTTPRSKKELQRLTGKLVALGRFIARFTDELRPFFLAIRKAGANGWTDSCQSALKKLNIAS